MFLFVDGNPLVLTFEQVEQLYYRAFVTEFGPISFAQWKGSYEYQALYPAIQMMVENGIITESSLDQVLQSIADINEQIKRPAVLHSRVSERFLEAGYIAVAREPVLATAGIMAVCVDYDPADPDVENIEIEIANLIADEMLPAGVHMEGLIDRDVTLSNGQSITITWSTPVETPVNFKITLTRDRNSAYPVDTVDVIVERFLANFAAQNALGLDITPKTYYQIARDAPWASDIVTLYGLNADPIDESGVYTALYTDKFIADLLPENVNIL